MKKNSLLIFLCSFTAFWSCGENDSDPTIQEGDDQPTQVESIASFEVSGSETFSIVDQPVVITKEAETSIEGVDGTFNIVTGVAGENNTNINAVAIGVFIPTTIGTVPPNGTITNISLDFEGTISEAIGGVTINTASNIYTSTAATTGTLIVSESSETEGSFTLTINLENLTTFDESTLDISGTISFK